MTVRNSTHKTLFVHKTRLHVNNKQANFFRGCAGFRRVAYNWALGRIKDEWENDEARLSPSAADKQFNAIKKDDFPWAYEYPSCVGQQSIADLKKGFDNFFRRVKRGENPGHPKFKGRRNKPSFRFTNAVIRDCHINGDQLKLPKSMGFCKMGSVTRHRGRIMSTTISEQRGKWYAAMLYELNYEPHYESAPVETVGVDLGVARLATMSDGSFVTTPDRMNQLDKKKQRLQKILSRKIAPRKGKRSSARWKKLNAKVNMVDAKRSDIRKDSAHQLTAKLARENSLVVIEDLKISNMTKSAKGTKEAPGKNVAAKSGLNRVILNSGLHEIRRQLEYKTGRHKGMLLAIDPKYTSQMCSSCGHVEKDNRKSQSSFVCLICGHSENADVNAAKNILNKGILELSA